MAHKDDDIDILARYPPTHGPPAFGVLHPVAARARKIVRAKNRYSRQGTPHDSIIRGSRSGGAARSDVLAPDTALLTRACARVHSERPATPVMRRHHGVQPSPGPRSCCLSHVGCSLHRHGCSFAPEKSIEWRDAQIHDLRARYTPVLRRCDGVIVRGTHTPGP